MVGREGGRESDYSGYESVFMLTISSMFQGFSVY